jgi:hypothetical protein
MRWLKGRRDGFGNDGMKFKKLKKRFSRSFKYFSFVTAVDVE